MSKKLDENITQFADFDIEQCHTFGAIENKLIYLANKEKSILEDLKEYDTLLQPKDYQVLHDIITGSFNNSRKQLNIRLDGIIKQRLTAETTGRKIAELRDDVQERIRNRNQIRLLRYQNRLYRRRSNLELKIKKRRARAEFKTIMQVLTEQNRKDSKSLPP